MNIAWIFFRAKEWEDAIRILKAMFFGDVLLSHSWISKFEFLREAGFKAGFWAYNLGNGEKAIYFILFSFIIILLKNSIQKKILLN